MNTVCHIEFHVTDHEKAKRFYGPLFGYQFREFGGEMVAFGTDEGHVGGLMLKDKVEPGRSPTVWIQVESVDAMLSRAPQHGGSVISGKEKVPTVGYSAVLGDPDGNQVGVVEFARED